MAENNIEARVSAHDAEIAAIRSDVHGLTKSFDSFAKDIRASLAKRDDQIYASLEKLDERFSRSIAKRDERFIEHSKPQWAAPIGAAAVAVTIMIALGNFASAGYIRDLERVELVQRDVRDNQLSHETSDGHSGVRQNRNALAKFDEHIQIEMRLLDDVLQREISLSNQIQDARVDGLEERITNLGSHLARAIE